MKQLTGVHGALAALPSDLSLFGILWRRIIVWRIAHIQRCARADAERVERLWKAVEGVQKEDLSR